MICDYHLWDFELRLYVLQAQCLSHLQKRKMVPCFLHGVLMRDCTVPIYIWELSIPQKMLGSSWVLLIINGGKNPTLIIIAWWDFPFHFLMNAWKVFVQICILHPGRVCSGPLIMNTFYATWAGFLDSLCESPHRYVFLTPGWYLTLRLDPAACGLYVLLK